MKIRYGFVSNSSSSSFCIIGVEDGKLLRQLAEAEKKNFSWDEEYNDDNDDLGYGCNEGKVVTFYGTGYPYHAGIDIADFSEDKSITEMKLELIAKAERQLDVNIPISKVQLLYGEASSE